jgi:hypothetical protein
LQQHRVFISSVMAGLEKERLAVASTVEELGAEAVWFESFGGRDADPEDSYLGEVASSTIYVGILGERYGRLLKSRFSATHEEYLAAEDAGLRISVWSLSSGDWDGRQESFVEEVRTFHTTGSFSGPEDLAEGVRRRLLKIAAEELSPWCKLGPAIFRAERIRAAGSGIEVTGLVRDPSVADAIEAMRSDTWGRSEAQYTDPFRSLPVQVDEVESVSETAGGRRMTVNMTVLPVPSHSFIDMTYSTGGQTYSADDLTELALKEHLFGEPSPSDVSSFTSIPPPLAGLPTGLADEILRPIVRLFLNESLVGSGRVTRLTKFRLGVPLAGGRRLVLEWAGSSRHANPPVVKRIEGVVTV